MPESLQAAVRKARNLFVMKGARPSADWTFFSRLAKGELKVAAARLCLNLEFAMGK